MYARARCRSKWELGWERGEQVNFTKLFYIFILLLYHIGVTNTVTTDPTSVTVCPGDSRNLTCSDSTVLLILSAVHGSWDSSECVQPTSNTTTFTPCTHSSSLVDIQQLCFRQHTCMINSSSLGYAAPCSSGASSYLNVTFTCVHDVYVETVCDVSYTARGQGMYIISNTDFPSSINSSCSSHTIMATNGLFVYINYILFETGDSNDDCEKHGLNLSENGTTIAQYCSSTTNTDSLIFTNLTVTSTSLNNSVFGEDIPSPVFTIIYEVDGCLESDILLPEHSYITSYTYGEQVSFACLPPFELSSSGDLNCVDGNWTGSNTTCHEVLRCDLLPTITNGQVSSHDGSPGSVATFSCIRGFQLYGNGTRVCQANATWTGVTPRCSHITCDHPGIPSHGQADPSLIASYPADTSITFSCDEGYMLHGESDLTCTDSGNWNHQKPSCFRVDCGVPPHVPNSRLEYIGTKYGHVATFWCIGEDPGMQNFILNCSSNATWTGPLPICASVETTMLPEPTTTQLLPKTQDSNVLISIISVVIAALLISIGCLIYYKYRSRKRSRNTFSGAAEVEAGHTMTNGEATGPENRTTSGLQPHQLTNVDAASNGHTVVKREKPRCVICAKVAILCRRKKHSREVKRYSNGQERNRSSTGPDLSHLPSKNTIAAIDNNNKSEGDPITNTDGADHGDKYCSGHSVAAGKVPAKGDPERTSSTIEIKTLSGNDDGPRINQHGYSTKM